MTNSKTSSMFSDTPEPSKSATKEPEGPRSQKDYASKLVTARALASAGYYVRINVDLSEPTLSGDWTGRLTSVTDVDVLGVTHAIDLVQDLVCVSCKSGSGKGLSPIREAFFLAGVLRYLDGHRGYAVFSEKRVEPHMVALAHQLNIGLFDRQEWESWCKRMTNSHPVPRQFEEALNQIVATKLDQWTDLRPLLAYLRTEFWYYRDYRNIQNVIAITKRVSSKFTTSPLGKFAFCDTLSMFSLSLLQLCRFVVTTGLLRMKETVPPYLFGGAPTYKSRRELLKRVEDLLRSRDLIRADQPLPPLDPAYLPGLLELVFRLCNRPSVAARLPSYLNIKAGEAASHFASDAPSESKHEDSLAQKFALDLADFFIAATGLPADLREAV